MDFTYRSQLWRAKTLICGFRERTHNHENFCHAVSAMYFVSKSRNFYHEIEEARPFHENIYPRKFGAIYGKYPVKLFNDRCTSTVVYSLVNHCFRRRGGREGGIKESSTPLERIND